MSILRIRRALDSAGVLRRMVMEVDGDPAAHVGHAKTTDVTVSPGRHTVRARMDWHAGPLIEVDVVAGEVVAVEVSYSFGAITQLFRRSEDAIVIRRVSA